MSTLGWRKQFCPQGHDTFICGRDKSGACKDCKKEWDLKHKEQIKKYHIANKEKLAEQQKKYQIANKEKIKKYKEETKEHRNEVYRKYYAARLKTDINFKLAHNLRSRLRQAIKGNYKVGSAVKDLGCSVPFFKDYIESLFYGDMTWENHGKYWELDHIEELHTFDLTDPIQFKRAVHYTNLQPLTIPDHIKKSAQVAKINP